MKYAALVDEQIHIPGDERSRTHPGHGYPEHTENVTKVVEFGDLEELKAWVSRQSDNPYLHRSYRLIQYEELKVTKEVLIHVSKD